MVKFVSKEKVEIFKTFDEVPYKVIGHEPDLSNIRVLGYCVHREELDNRPHYEGFIGPMWDGGDFRYETQEIYDMLST